MNFDDTDSQLASENLKIKLKSKVLTAIFLGGLSISIIGIIWINVFIVGNQEDPNLLDQNVPQSNYFPEITSDNPQISIRPSIKDVNVGDRIGDFTILNVTHNLDLGLFGASFSGSTEVLIQYRGPGHGGACANVDNSSAHKIPYFQEDTRSLWFCFSNEDFADRALSASLLTTGGRARVIIKDYSVIYADKGVANSAELVEVISIP